MRTVRCSGRVCLGGVCPRVVSARRCLSGGVYTPTVNRITDRCKNITFPQLRLRTVTICKLQPLLQRIKIHIFRIEELCTGDFEHGVRNLSCTSGHLFSTIICKSSGHVIQWSDFFSLYLTRWTGHIVCSYLCMMQVTNCSPNMSMFRFLVAKRITLSRASQMARFGLYSWILILDHVPCGFNKEMRLPLVQLFEHENRLALKTPTKNHDMVERLVVWSLKGSENCLPA